MSHPIALICPSCGSPLQPEAASGGYPIGRCLHCRTVCALPTAQPPRIPRPVEALPKSMTLTAGGEALVITRRWRNFTVWILLFFAVFWNGFMLVWHGIAWSQGIWIMSLFGMLHTAVGAGLIYYVFALFLNRTEVRVSGGTIEVRHAPLPWPGNKRVAARDIQQLYCRQKVTHGDNSSSTSYNVEMVHAGNRRMTLLTGLTSADQAIFHEQQLESRLGIADVPVDGEFRG